MSNALFGICCVQSKGYWLVRLMSQDAGGHRRYRNKTVSFKAHGGKTRSLAAAKACRDELLRDPDVMRYREATSQQSGARVRSQYNKKGKRAFPNLVGINLVIDSKKNRPYFAVRALVGSPGTDYTPSDSAAFSLVQHGLWGALTLAIDHREQRTQQRYDPALIRKDYEAVLKTHRKALNEQGIDPGTGQAPRKPKPAWFDMSPEALRKILPPSPSQVGVSLIIAAGEKKGAAKSRVYFVGHQRKYGHKETFYLGSLNQGVWSSYRDCMKATLRGRNEPKKSDEVLREEYRKWLRGYTRNMRRIGFDTDG